MIAPIAIKAAPGNAEMSSAYLIMDRTLSLSYSQAFFCQTRLGNGDQ